MRQNNSWKIFLLLPFAWQLLRLWLSKAHKMHDSSRESDRVCDATQSLSAHDGWRVGGNDQGVADREGG